MIIDQFVGIRRLRLNGDGFLYREVRYRCMIGTSGISQVVESILKVANFSDAVTKL